MKNLARVLGIAMMLSWVFLSGCKNLSGSDDESGSEPTEQSGEINGKALFSNADNHAGITINLEKTDGLVSQSVSKSLQEGRAVYSNGETVTSTAADGSYRFTGVSPGTYTVYASSQSSKERAVTANVTVLVAQSITAENLNLTPVGSIKGQVLLDGTPSGNSGFLVFIASTSYMAMTDEVGSFVISDVPITGGAYKVYIAKGTYIGLWQDNIAVNAGVASELGVKTLTIDALTSGGSGIIWKGTLTGHPANPELNWAYYNSTDKTSYIWDGTAWRILSVDGQNGANGATGANGTNGQDGVSLVWKGTLTGHPANPELNWAYYNSTDGKAYIWDGTWQTLSVDGQNGADGATGAQGPQGETGADGTNGTNGVSLVWKGTLAEAPANPELNWAYYNSTDKTSYIWDGDAWQILAKDGADGIPPASYTITYVANGALGNVPAAETVSAGSIHTVAGQGALNYAGKTFSGWNTSTDGTGTPYAANSTLTLNENITLYAQWTAIVPIYSVTYNANGASGTVPAAQTANAGSSITVAAQGDLSYSGRTFNGWNTNAGGTGTSYAASASLTVSANITLYARWTANAADVTVNFTGPTDETINLTVPGATVSWGANTAITVTVPSGFTVTAWYVDGTLEAGVSSATLTMHAQDFAPGSHTITAKVSKDGNAYTKRATFRVVE